MKVKGTIITSVQNYLKANFPGQYQDWLKTLPPSSQKMYTNAVMATEWYDYQDALIKPTEQAANFFFNKDVKKISWEIGRYSAEVGLTGIYKVFILIATPQFIMKRGGKILSSFYQPSFLEVPVERPKGVDIHITEFPEPSEVAENRIGGWMEKALEICGVKNISIQKISSMVKGDDKTIYVVNWV